jgi:transcription antitermination factor NusG
MWTVAAIKAGMGQADLAVRNLTRQNFEIFHPTFTRKILCRGRLMPQETPLFSGYLMIFIPPGRIFSPIRSTPGVMKLITYRGADGYDHPSPLPPSFVETMQSACTEEVEKQQRRWRLRPGVTVRILNGPFADSIGIVEWSSDQRVRLLISLLNRSGVPVEVGVDDVVVVEEGVS